MIFNSLDFAIFLPIVFAIYWLLNKGSLKVQNLFIVLASYVFYGWWDYRFLALIIFSTLVDFVVGIYLNKCAKQTDRKILLWISIGVNLGLLGFFKYYNFFVDNFVNAFTFFGYKIEPYTLSIILPVGISFYTFQTLSYSIDIYRCKLEPTKDIVAFAAFVSFFPQLVAGPIERASNLLPQFYKKRSFNYANAIDGGRQILWGLFKKVVIADNCAKYVNTIFNDYQEYSGSTLFLGGIFFAFQIYGDFSGYSDIAIGTSRLFGFNLKQNFAYPYFSRDIAEFWRRWHISLSTWFRDYLYIPLGGSRGTKINQVRNVFIIFVVSGFWHGANWTFIVWGALNAAYFLPLLLLKRNRVNIGVVAQNSRFPKFREITGILVTFLLTVIAWIFFRSESMGQAIAYLKIVFSKTIFTIPQVRPTDLMIMIVIFLCFEWVGRREKHALEHLWFKYPRPLRWGLYFCIAMSILLLGGEAKEFIYFQF